jgi:hypothetical protein
VTVPDRAAPSGPVADALYLAVEEMTERTSYGIDLALAFEDALARARKILAMLPSSAAAPCPHVRQDAEGSAYCTLAERAAPSGEPSEPPDLSALRDLVADIINAPSPEDEREAERHWLERYEIRLRATPAEPGASPRTRGYRIAGESVTDAVGEEMGRLFAERDRLRDQVSAANLLREQTGLAARSPAPAGDAPREDALRYLVGALSALGVPSPENVSSVANLEKHKDKLTADVWRAWAALRGAVSPSPGTRAASEGEA